MGTEAQLEFIFLDTCGHGMKFLWMHPTTSISSNVTQGPKADNFHKIKLSSSATLTGHPSHTPFSKYV